MKVGALVKLPVDGKDPVVAFEAFAQLARRIPLPRSSSLALTLWTLRPSTILRELAAELPADAPGFFPDGQGSQWCTAGEYLGRGSGPVALETFQGTLPMEPGKALSTLERLLPLHRRALLSLALEAATIRWPGVVGGVEGQLILRATRGAKPRPPVLAALARLSVRSPRDPALTETLARLQQATGIAFSSAKLTPEQQPQQLSMEQRFVIGACFREAVARAAGDLEGTGSGWRDLPLLCTGWYEAFNRRLRAVTAGRSERVNPDPAFRRAMKAAMPDYEPQKGEEALLFRKPLDPGLDLVLAIHKVHQMGLGKTFYLALGVLPPSERRLAWFEADLFALLGHESPAGHGHCWAYTTSVELEQAVTGAVALARRVVPALEARAAELLCPLPEEPPPDLPRRPDLTARQALQAAEGAIRAWSVDARLRQASLMMPEDDRRAAAPTGTAPLRGEWVFALLSPSEPHQLWLSVPSIGRIRPSLAHLDAQARDGMLPPPAPPQWLDSDAAMIIAERVVGAAARGRATGPVRLILTLELGWRQGPARRWTVHYQLPTTRGPERVLVTIDAETGEASVSAG